MKIPPFRLERYFAKYEFNTEYLLGSSDCESLAIDDLLQLESNAEERFKKSWLGYTESQGSPSLRHEICQIYRDITPEQILVHAGAQEAIFTFMQAVLDPGDHLIVHWPCYQSLYSIAESIGCKVTFWKSDEEQNWRLDADDLPAMIQPNTRAIIINTPHNPTGYLMSQDVLESIWELSSSRGILLFIDEVYRESEYDPQTRLPAACELGDLGVSLGVTSKTYGLAGLRIGWIATRNEALLRKISLVKDYTTICSSAPSEFLAELALRYREKLASRNLEIVQSNLALLDPFFTRHVDKFNWIKPVAGPIAFPRLLIGDVEDFCETLVADQGVMLLPGTVYDHPGNHFRIGFGRANLPQALERLENFLADFIK